MAAKKKKSKGTPSRCQVVTTRGGKKRTLCWDANNTIVRNLEGAHSLGDVQRGKTKGR